MDVPAMLEMPEHIYIQQFMEYAQGLPPEVQSPVSAMDASAFGSFLGNASHGYFKKYLVLHSLNTATIYQPDHRFKGEHYVRASLFDTLPRLSHSPSGSSHRSSTHPARHSHVCRHAVSRGAERPFDQRRVHIARVVQSSSSARRPHFLHRSSV